MVCQIPYGLETTYQSALCGTAFDYLARFCIARVAKKNSDEAIKNLVAERFINYQFNMFTLQIDCAKY